MRGQEWEQLGQSLLDVVVVVVTLAEAAPALIFSRVLFEVDVYEYVDTVKQFKIHKKVNELTEVDDFLFLMNAHAILEEIRVDEVDLSFSI